MSNGGTNPTKPLRVDSQAHWPTERSEIIKTARRAYGGVFPYHELPSGVMFYMGERITRDDFIAASKATDDCLHDETERLGSIWTHCTQCGKSWADDDPKRPIHGPQPVDGVEVLADGKPLPESEWLCYGIERADLLDARSGTVTAFARHGRRITIQPTPVTVRVPWGTFTLGGAWQHNPAISMSAAEQRAQNEAAGYKCPDAPICGCLKELRAMLEHPAIDFDHRRACHCAAYAPSEQCDCEFCKSCLAASAGNAGVQPTAAPSLKDHQIAQTVNALTIIAREYGKTQQLRERIAGVIVPILKGEGFPKSIVSAYAPPPKAGVAAGGKTVDEKGNSDAK